MNQYAKQQKTLGQRLLQVFEYYKSGNVKGFEKVGKDEFAQLWGISYAMMNNYFNDANEMKIETIKKFAMSFPIINIDWVLTGNGEMLKYESGTGFSEEQSKYHTMPQRHQDLLEAAIEMTRHFKLFQESMNRVAVLAEI